MKLHTLLQILHMKLFKCSTVNQKDYNEIPVLDIFKLGSLRSQYFKYK